MADPTEHDPLAPDPIFAHPRLAQIYDAIDSDRRDLDLYVSIAKAFDVETVLDVGCGTGTLACLLASEGITVTAVDPAGASLDVARTKRRSEEVRWLNADATTLPPLRVDMATMTGNVAQVFVHDTDWLATLSGIAAAVRPSGSLVFETRIPARRAWEQWNRESSSRRIDIAGAGMVETWVELTDVSLPLVSFRWTYRFEADGTTLTSDSTLRFRTMEELESTLTSSGWKLSEVRDAPDRPGQEYVCIATR